MSRSSPVTATLKPCPFCGGPAYVHETEGQRPDESSFSVHCDGCEATHATDRDRVVSAWNRRFDFAQCPDQRVLDDMTLAHNVRKTTIEECARLCDGLRRKDYSMENADWVAGTLDCATAIRSLADTSTDRTSK